MPCCQSCRHQVSADSGVCISGGSKRASRVPALRLPCQAVMPMIATKKMVAVGRTQNERTMRRR